MWYTLKNIFFMIKLTMIKLWVIMASYYLLYVQLQTRQGFLMFHGVKEFQKSAMESFLL